MPIPIEAIARVNSTLSASGRMALIINTRPPQAISRPERINCRGERWLARRDPIRAIKNRQTDIGSMRIPDSSALSPSTVCRYSGITKNVPATMK